MSTQPEPPTPREKFAQDRTRVLQCFDHLSEEGSVAQVRALLLIAEQLFDISATLDAIEEHLSRQL